MNTATLPEAAVHPAALLASPEGRAAVLAQVDGLASVREAAAALRASLEPLRIVVVDAMDMRDETPAVSGERYQLFLAASDGHCWTVTQDPAQVAGLYISPRS
jgi:hypothetical protein